MASEADRVVVELIAKNDQFDATVRQSSATYQQSMKAIETSGGAAETSHKRLTASVGNSRIAMMEFGHIARGTADQIAAGAPLTQVLAQHMGMLGQAVSLSGGIFGRFGAFLGGPWGLALTVAAAGVATLILRHKEESDTVEEVLKKRMKMHEQTLLNKQADEAWSHTLDGLIEGLQKTNDELGKRLKLQPVVDQQALQSANAALLSIGQRLVTEEDNPGATPARLQKLRQAFAEAVKEVHQLTLIMGREEGAALADLSERADQWAARQQDIIDRLQGYHPELAAFSAQLNAAFALMKKAVSDAASADVPFDDVTRQVDALNNKLAQSPGSVREYVSELRRLAAQLEATAEAAKELRKQNPVEQFKKSVIGAEGTGPNRLGSSAAGFGQFMPSTWLSYFNRLFPDKANLDNAVKLSFRDVRSVAEAVIDKATDDYVAVIKAAGEKVTAANLYAVHLLGQRDATKLFNAAPGTAITDVLSKAVLSGNPFLKTAPSNSNPLPVFVVGAPRGLLQEGNIDVMHRPHVSNRDGSVSTVRSMSFGAEQGEVLVPTVSESGRILTVKQAIDLFYKTGKHLGIFASPEDATNYALSLHDQQASLLRSSSGTAAGARAAIARRIGDSSGQVSQAAVAIQQTLNKDLEEQQRALDKILNQHQDVTLEHEHQVNLIEDYNRGLSVSETLAGQNELALKDWNKQFEQINNSMEEANRFGAQFIDDVLNPDNWDSWGDAAKRILHEVMLEILALGAANPLKNLLFGGNRPTLGSIFGQLFGGGGGLGASIFPVVGGVDPLAPLPARASGGPVSAGQSYVVGEDGPEVFRPSSSGMIIPNRKVSPSNDRAVAPLAGMSPAVVHVLIEASKYFDGRVMEVSGPVIAQASVAAANGGATIGRRNLGRESMHRLEL